jgi:hypothetical protein
MAIILAQIPEADYPLRRERAVASGKPKREIVRLAPHAYLLEGVVDATDPIFHIFPIGASGKRGHRVARDHVDLLCGPRK